MLFAYKGHGWGLNLGIFRQCVGRSHGLSVGIRDIIYAPAVKIVVLAQTHSASLSYLLHLTWSHGGRTGFYLELPHLFLDWVLTSPPACPHSFLTAMSSGHSSWVTATSIIHYGCSFLEKTTGDLTELIAASVWLMIEVGEGVFIIEPVFYF